MMTNKNRVRPAISAILLDASELNHWIIESIGANRSPDPDSTSRKNRGARLCRRTSRKGSAFPVGDSKLIRGCASNGGIAAN